MNLHLRGGVGWDGFRSRCCGQIVQVMHLHAQVRELLYYRTFIGVFALDLNESLEPSEIKYAITKVCLKWVCGSSL